MSDELDDGPAKVFVVTAIVPAHDDGSTVRFVVQEFPPSRGVCVYASVSLDSPAVELQESIAAVLEEGAGCCAPTLHWGWDDGHWPMDGGGGGTLTVAALMAGSGRSLVRATNPHWRAPPASRWLTVRSRPDLPVDNERRLVAGAVWLDVLLGAVLGGAPAVTSPESRALWRDRDDKLTAQAVELGSLFRRNPLDTMTLFHLSHVNRELRRVVLARYPNLLTGIEAADVAEVSGAYQPRRELPTLMRTLSHRPSAVSCTSIYRWHLGCILPKFQL